MQITPISFGIQFKHKKNYEVQRRNGTVVPKDVADKVVKRNMILFGTLVFPTLMGVVLTFFSGRKHSLKEVAPWCLLLSVLGVYWSNTDYQLAKHSKDYDPKPFYRWGGFKVVEKENKK